MRLELLPKSTVDVFITIIENDGIEGCISAGAVAASAALADAGIDLFGMVMSCSAVRETKYLKANLYLCLHSALWVKKFGWTRQKMRCSAPQVPSYIPACLRLAPRHTSGKQDISRYKTRSAYVPVPTCQCYANDSLSQCLEECQKRCTDVHVVVAQALLENVKPS